MPNWCYNHLKVETSDPWTDTDKEKDKIVEKDRKELAKFKKENFNENGFTFQGVVPMPKELNITSGSSTDSAIAYINATKAGKKDWTEIDKMISYQWTAKSCGFKQNDSKATKRKKIVDYLSNDLNKTAIKEGKQALSNLEKYGYKDWYNWSINNWGTKWDARNEDGICNDTEDELFINFDTAWAPPIQWLEKATKKYKRLKFSMEYTEEGMGFEGKTYAKNGQCVDNCMSVDHPDDFWD